MTMPTNIVVLGAGVSGLTTALLLTKGSDNTVTVVAKHMPGDYDIEYTSPWAGANVLPMSKREDSRWERRTWPELKRLAEELPEAGIHKLKSLVYRSSHDISKPSTLSDSLFDEHPWYDELFDDYRKLSTSEVPKGIAWGHEFGSICINTPMYLSWLVGQCRKQGVTFKRASLKHISEAVSLHASADAPEDVIIVNATGLGSFRLGGIEDKTMYPARGQVVVVRNEAPAMKAFSTSSDGSDEMCYIMMRAAGGGTILGGTYQKGNWDANPDPNIATRIMQRAVEADPGLAGGKGVAGLDIIRHGVGLRPCREDGVRIEKEKVGGNWVVHNYGHAGWGYQASYGCAERVVELVDEVRSRRALER